MREVQENGGWGAEKMRREGVTKCAGNWQGPSDKTAMARGKNRQVAWFALPAKRIMGHGEKVVFYVRDHHTQVILEVAKPVDMTPT